MKRRTKTFLQPHCNEKKSNEQRGKENIPPREMAQIEDCCNNESKTTTETMRIEKTQSSGDETVEIKILRCPGGKERNPHKNCAKSKKIVELM